MNIIIDMQSLQCSSKNRGIGHYTKSLLTQISVDWSEHEITLLFNKFDKKNIEELCFEHEDYFDSFNVIFYEGLRNSIESSEDYLERVQLSEELRHTLIESLEPDIVLITSLVEGGAEEFACSIPIERSYKVGVIGYDLIPLINPDMHLVVPSVKQWYMRKVEQYKNADMIFAISESARREFIKYLEINPDSVVNISSACSKDYFEVVFSDEKVKFLNKIGLSDDYVLYSGACDERKNLFRLIDAFSKLNSSLIQKYKLVLVGKYSDIDKAHLSKYVKKCGLGENQIIYTGYITNRELNILYSHCSLFVFPSLHEGFGLPVLEAMTCGAPVICSNTSSLPEVIGLEEATFNPESVEEIKDLMFIALTSDTKREALIENAKARRKLFSWEITANRVLNQLLYMVSNNKGQARSDVEDYMVKRLSTMCEKLNVDDVVMREVACCISENCNIIKSNY